MLIRSIELTNFKSYESGIIEFQPGVNTVCGPNGAGKSTLLEAVGFALFGAAPVRQADLIREGSKSSGVAVTFVDNLDGRPYQVVRRWGTDHAHYVYDPETRLRLAEGAESVGVWVRQHLCVDAAADLEALFTDAVGVPQGMMTAPFAQPEALRKRTFNPLLQVDEWESARTNLAATETHLRDGQQRIAIKVAGLAGQLAQLTLEAERVPELRLSVEVDAAAVVALQSRVAAASEAVAAFAVADRARAELVHAVALLEQELAGLTRAREDRRTALDAARAAVAACAETAADYRRHAEAGEELTVLEGERTERDALRARAAAVEQRRTLAAQAVERAVRDLTTVAAAEREREALLPKIAEQDRLDLDQRSVEVEVTRLEEARVRRGTEESRLELARSERERVAAGVVACEGHEAGLALLQGEEAADAQAATLIGEAVVRAETELSGLRERRELLAGAGGATCPVCREPLAPARARELADAYATEIATQDGARVAASARRDVVVAARAARATLIAAHTRALQSLPRPDRLAEVDAQVVAQANAVVAAVGAVETLAGAPTRLAGVRVLLEALGDPRGCGQGLAATLARKVEFAGERAVWAAAEAMATGEQREVADLLRAHAELDARLDAVRTTRATTADAHARYLGSVQQAATVDAHAGTLAELDRQARALGTRVAAEVVARDAAIAAYDSAAHERTRKLHEVLVVDHATAAERLKNNRAALGAAEEAARDVAHLVVQLAALRDEDADAADLLDATKVIRQVLKDAGPDVTRALVARISDTAAQLFADLMGDNTLHLRWDETYQITVQRLGRDRGFKQLSGGEQMAAALSVRLALLTEMTGITTAFFDEPTTNLDATRRDNLAAKLTNIAGFGQLVVITHDDAFEQLSEHSIRIRKENGVSLWETA